MNTNSQNEHQNCLICSSKSLRLLNEYSLHNLCQCENCNFVFAKNIPTEKELEKHYEGYGRNDYLSPLTINRYNELLDSFEKYRKTNRILDVGCGIGYFLEVSKGRGWEVYGTEYTDEAIQICTSKGINMEKGVLDPKNYRSEQFDIITSFEVIEHINNPVNELTNFHALLRKGGLVYLTTPNFNSLLRYRLKSAYNVICYPEHLSYYTPKTLKKIFTSAGFKTKKIQSTGISLTRLKTSKRVSKQSFISKESDDEKIRGQIEKHTHLQLLKHLVNRLLTIFGKGDSLKGWFIKE
jgi:2-polyprenyl-3-methyl-5-hydroxy-6-metoxy-1,4-benzoquinol methylase